MAKWISAFASTLSPLQISISCTFPRKKRTLCSAISMTARSVLRAERKRKVGWKGKVGGGGPDRLGGVREEGLRSTPLSQPQPPNQPLAHPQHLVHVEAVLAAQIVSNGQGLRGGVPVRGVGVVVAVRGVRGPQVKESPLQRILRVGGGGKNPMLAAALYPS